MNSLEKKLMDAPSIVTPVCVFCGRKATNKHHVVFRSQGGKDGPVLSVCGCGNMSGCHGKLHSRRLHVRYEDGEWQYLETSEPTKYQTALEMEGWKPIRARKQLVYTFHSSKATRDLYCDGRQCFEILLRSRKSGERIDYWCGKMQSRFNPFCIDAESCPQKGFEIWVPKFNG